MHKILVFGGAGYIGSITSQLFVESGHKVCVVDNLSTGHKDYTNGTQFVKADILDKQLISEICSDFKPDVVLHFAAKIQVEESVSQPFEYFENNVLGSLNIIQSALDAKIKNFVFSSTAAVYGEPKKIPIKEQDPKNPINPYGLSKLVVEQMLESYQRTHDLNWVAFRYFNAAGAYKGRAMDYPFMSHLIPRAVESVIQNEPFKIYGNDYPTQDGSCVRDFVHVVDVARAHVTAAHKMLANEKIQTAVNLGSGSGYSVLQVVKQLEKTSGKKLDCRVAPRRAGDPAVLIANSSKARQLLDWAPLLTLEDMVASHWNWRTKS